MDRLEQLEEFRRTLQSVIKIRENTIGDYDIPANTPYTIHQTSLKRLLGFVVQEKRKIHKYEKELNDYWKHLKEMEEENV